MAGVVFAGLSPHPPVAVPEVGGSEREEIADTVASMEELANQVQEADPDLIVTIGPHGPVFSDAISILNRDPLVGDLSDFGAEDVQLEYPLAEEFITEIAQACHTQDIQVARIDQRAAQKFDIELKLDHGAVVPLSYLKEAGVDVPLVPITMGMLSYEDLYKFGKIVQLLARELDYKIAVIASGDLSHRLTPNAPAGFNPRGSEFDESLVQYLDDLAIEKILNLESSLIEKAGECGLRPITMMLGTLDALEVTGGVLSYEGPFGVGYAVASYQVTGRDQDRSLLETIEQQKKDKLAEIREEESKLVKLARKAVEEYALQEEVVSPPAELSPELVDQAGVFVSIKKDGNLRGCIGSTKPTEANIAQEIIKNAISAGFKDPRFEAIEPEELEKLTYSVDVLGEPEEVASIDQLDPEQYGVIVKKGAATGLLLPNIEGVNDAHKQVEVAKRKAGIPEEDDEIELMRFEVTRYK
ncbi:AmmeMemoRadiSam system protein A [Halanaerobaculum tunisiense]